MLANVRRILWPLAVVAALFAIVPASGAATDAPATPNKASDTTVITADEIQANGYHSLAEALRWVRGLYVVDDHTYSYVGVRGVQRPGDYNNKVLVTIDGHAMAGSVYGDTYLGPELGLDIERVERIEVIRGQGTSLYGANAVLAVVNVVTRPPGPAQAFEIAAWTGGPSERRAAFSMNSARSSGPQWAFSASLLDEKGLDLYESAFDGVSTNGARITGQRASSILGRMEWGGVHLGVKFNERMQPTSDEPVNHAYDGHNFVEMSRSQNVGSAFVLDGRGYWDGSRYRVYSTDPTPVTNVEFGTGDVVGTEWRLHWSSSASAVQTLGVEGQYYARAHLFNYDEAPYTVYEDRDLNRKLGAIYMQDQRSLGNRLNVTTGARFDAYSGYKPVVSPRFDMVWSAASNLDARLGAGSAFRVPTVFEINDRASQAGAKALDPERVVSFEGSLERRLGPHRAILTGYMNDLRDLIDLTDVDTSGTAGYSNRSDVRARGVEGEFDMAGKPGDQMRLALAWQMTTEQEGGAELSDSPRWNANVVVTHAPPTSWYSIGGGVRWLSSRLTGGGDRSDDAVIADARFGARILTSTILGLEVKNLFNTIYSDPVTQAPVRDPVLQDPRTIYLTFSHQAGGFRQAGSAE